MELYSPARLSWRTPRARLAECYLGGLPLRPERRRELLRRVSASRAEPAEVMAELHRILSGELATGSNPAYDSVRGRLEMACGPAGRRELVARDAQGRPRVATTPPLSRSPMAPKAWGPGAFARLLHRLARILSGAGATRPESPAAPAPRVDWHAAGARRRALLLTLSVAQTALAAWCMTAVLPYHGRKPLEIAVLALFVVLFGWVSAGFWTAMMGFLTQLLRGDRFVISRSAKAASIDPAARTAVIMPIANEDVQRVFAGLRATYESLSRTAQARHFDCFVLSDSADADVRVAEMQAWMTLCRDLGAFGRVFYRWRQHRIKRKSGNVGDFCRRWGRKYRYMVVLDADSVMSGECLVQLMRLMEANPNAGIIQTAPRAAGRETLFARVQQFANRLYGPLFTAGLHFWQLGESHYWGHNAIIRIEPFIRHCALGRIPGEGTFSGEILSHDFVEAALMRRAGWGVWMAYDLPGSYEEMPPNLVDELKRDRRWCHGNLINSRLMFREGLHPAHRAVFMTGVMAYLSAPLWFLFLLLSTLLLAVHTLVPPQYFVEPHQLFPLWPEWHQEWAIALSGATAVLLFLPKVLAVLLGWLQGARGYGGAIRLAFGMLGEMLFSAVLAPIRMLFHTQFVLTSLLGWKVHWQSPPRDDAQTTWAEALRRHGWHTLLGIGWAALVRWLNPAYLWWLLPVVGALALSIPISVMSSRSSLGRRLARAGLFFIPEESSPPPELARVRDLCAQTQGLPGFVDAVVDPLLNALACATGVARTRLPAEARAQREALVAKALRQGAKVLGPKERAILLGDPLALSQLHFAVWTAPECHAAWDEAKRPLRDNVIALVPKPRQQRLPRIALPQPERPRPGLQ